MGPDDGKPDSIDISNLLSGFRTRGVSIWCEGGRLRYRAPQGLLTPEDIGRLAANRAGLIRLLEFEAVGSKDEWSANARLSPLTHSQRVHWNAYRLIQRHGVRQIASALRIRGRLVLDALQAAVNDVIHRHDSLRTQIALLDGIPMQRTQKEGFCGLDIDDLAGVSGSSNEEIALQQVDEYLLRPVDVGTDALVGMRLLRIGVDDHILVTAMEHSISDAASLGIFLRDLFAFYRQNTKTAIRDELPSVGIQFPDYAVWQQGTHAAWLEKHSSYWNTRLMTWRRLHFPDDLAGTNDLSGWSSVSLVIDAQLRSSLSRLARQQQTTLVITVFSAFAALVLRWCNVREAVFPFQIDGRDTPGLEDSIGYFSSTLYVHVEFLPEDRFVDLLRRVMSGYCTAYEHRDADYAESRLSPPTYTHNSAFNWIPRGPDDGTQLASLDGMECSALRFQHPMLKTFELDWEPTVLMFDDGYEVRGEVSFAAKRFSEEYMQRFAQSLITLLRAVLAEPYSPILRVPMADLIRSRKYP